MPKVDGAKTKSARKKRIALYGIGIALALFAMLAPTIFYRAPTAELQVGNHKVSLEIAETDATRTKGLGGRKSLAADKGMLFVFTEAGKQCFWMKGMRFPLDMVFVSHTKQVVHIESNVSPRTYPKSFCADDTQYVIELNAGRAKALGLHSGQTLSF